MAHVEITPVVLNNTDSREVMQALYDFYKSGGGPVTIAAPGGVDAVSLDGTTPSGAIPTAFGDWTDFGYIVIEGVHANGGVWQQQIQLGTSDDLNSRSSARGGFVNATEFATVTTTVTGYERWNDGAVPPTGTVLFGFSSDVPEFESGKKLVATAMILVNPGNIMNEGYACGGLYLPSGSGDSPTDDHPWLHLAGNPKMDGASTSWSQVSGSSNGGGPVEGDHTTALPVGAGITKLNAASPTASADFDGREAMPPLWARTVNNTLGVVASAFMVGVDKGVANGQTYPAGGYTAYNAIAFKLS